MDRKKYLYKSWPYIIAGALLILAAGLLFLAYWELNFLSKPKIEAQVPINHVQSETKPTPAKIVQAEPAPVIIPATADLIVPYTVQAPFANWAVHEESCEEAALLMYHDFLAGQKTDIDPATADQQIRAMKAWQVTNWGAERDLTIEKVGELAKDYYGHNYTVTQNLTQDDIKKQIIAGHPLLVPVMTQSLQNPHYSPGNVYHILLIKGYDATGVITNDAGIKEGKDWHYSWGILWSAIDAQTPKMGQGRVGLIITN
jgi:hypothetical protein